MVLLGIDDLEHILNSTTMNTKHTPGPWIIGRNRSQIESGNSQWTIGLSLHNPMEDGTILGASGCRGDEYLSIDVNSNNAEANARLIAAAPELLEALESLAERVDGYSYDPDIDTGIASALGRIAEAARAAINKATL